MEPKDYDMPIGLSHRFTNGTHIGEKNPYINSNEIEIPENFKIVILKMCPEISKIESVGYKMTAGYNPSPIEKLVWFLVGINIYFNENNLPKGNRSDYDTLLNDYFRMTYGGEMDFITFKVESFIIPPNKNNEHKFFELFKKK
jgi:hypothetical protein